MHLVRFVDSISEAPTVRLDLNDGVDWLTEYEATDFTPPPLRRTTTSNQLVDGDLVTSAVYENRTIGLDLSVVDSTANNVANQFKRLHMELDRPSNILQFKREGASRSVFFRTLRSDLNSVRELPSSSNYFELEARILAEPFGIGSRIELAPDTISGTIPAAQEFVFGSIYGDVDTPLLMKLTGDSITTSLGGSVFAIGTRRRGNPGAVTFANASSGSASPAATPGGTLMLIFDWPTTAGTVSSPDFVGDYRIFASGSKSVGATVFAAWVTGDQGAFKSQECLIDTTSTSNFWFDLGVMSIPAGSSGRYDGYGAPLAAQSMTFIVWARRVSGSAATFTINSLYFVPADQELCTVAAPALSNGTVVLDGPNDALYVTVSGALVQTGAFARRGKLPVLSPGAQQTRLVMLNKLQGPSSGGGSAGTVTFSYWPRYRYLPSDPDVATGSSLGQVVALLPKPTADLNGLFANGALAASLPRPAAGMQGTLLPTQLVPDSVGSYFLYVDPPPDTNAHAVTALSDSSDSTYVEVNGSGSGNPASVSSVGFTNVPTGATVQSFTITIRASTTVGTLSATVTPSLGSVSNFSGLSAGTIHSLTTGAKVGPWTAAQINALTVDVTVQASGTGLRIRTLYKITVDLTY